LEAAAKKSRLRINNPVNGSKDPDPDLDLYKNVPDNFVIKNLGLVPDP
jgi:hypothetical protein